MPSIRVHPEVADALERGTAVVALESAVITSGLPRDPLPPSAADRLRAATTHRPILKNWDFESPVNLELGRAMQRAVRINGAVPAIVAILQGDLCIGLDDDELVMLADEICAAKASVTDLAHIMASGGSAGTTVSATLAACASLESRILVFATGGIGGVHRDWQHQLDISADLRQIACTPICTVCSGAKSILDLPATVEALESLGVPLLGFGTRRFPQFLSLGDDSLRVSKQVDTAGQAATICDLHWNTLHSTGGILLCNPVPADFAMQNDELEQAIVAAERTAVDRHIHGAARTPFLLAELARLTAGRSLTANLALLLNNAQLAAQLAVALATIRPRA